MKTVILKRQVILASPGARLGLNDELARHLVAAGAAEFAVGGYETAITAAPERATINADNGRRVRLW